MLLTHKGHDISSVSNALYSTFCICNGKAELCFAVDRTVFNRIPSLADPNFSTCNLLQKKFINQAFRREL